MSIVIKHLTDCNAKGCFSLHTAEHNVQAGAVHAPFPSLPHGWQQIGTDTFCPRHKIDVAIVIDGEKYEPVQSTIS